MTSRLGGSLVYVGTYTSGRSEGIYLYTLDGSGALHFNKLQAGVDEPSFLAISPKEHYLYAVNETTQGTVSAFAIDPQTGELSYLNRQPSYGSPCHLTVDKAGQYVLVANYGGGSVCVLPILEGQLGEATSFVQHEGSSIDPERQNAPHAHSVVLDAANRFAFSADLGLDKIMVYKFDVTRGKLRPHDEPWVQLSAGAGPRHFTFHPNGRYAYVINELNSTVTAFNYDPTRGTLSEANTVSTLPEGFTGENSCADVHVHPSGRFIYGSNRGHDSIVVFEIDERTGRLSYVDHAPTLGKTPRNFAIHPSGTFLLAANQDTDNVVTFRIDESGRLTPTGHLTEVPTPVCLKIIHRLSQLTEPGNGT
jgi:6-phosphogluconolactonase